MSTSSATASHQLTITKATATSDDGNVPGNVLDNNLNTRWSAQGKGQKLFLDLDKEYAVDGVDIIYFNASSRTSTCDVLVGTTKIATSIISETAKPVTRITFNPTKGNQVTIIGQGNSVNDWNSVIDVKVFGTEVGGTTTPPPVVEPPPTPTGGGLDAFGTKMINPTKQGGRVFNAPFNTGTQRTLRSGQRDGTSDLKPLGNGTYTIYPNVGEMKCEGSAPRVYIYDEARQKMFENVEITCYYKSVSTTSAIAKGYQGFELSCRGQHELAGTNARVYYARHSLNGTWWRMKEDVHPTSKDVTIKTGIAFNPSTWYGMKWVVRNSGTTDVRMQSYRDTTDGKDGGNWVLMDDFTDKKTAPWAGYPIYKMGTPNCGCHSVFARTDNAVDFRIKKFSIREIVPLL